MEIAVELWDALEDGLATWIFRMNGDGDIDVVVSEIVMETFEPTDRIVNEADLFVEVIRLLKVWNVDVERVTAVSG